MRLNYLLMAMLVIACSDSGNEEPTPVTPCNSDLAGLAISNQYIYTGDVITLSLTKLCTDDKVTLFVNDSEVVIKSKTETTIEFTFPQITAATAKIKVTVEETSAEISKTVPVFFGGGDWVHVSTFPGDGRAQATYFSTTTNGYVAGGYQFVRNPSSPNNMDQHQYPELYSYDPSTTQWTLIKTDDNFKVISTGALAGDEFALHALAGRKKFSLSQLSFSPLANYAPSGTALWESTMFSVGGKLYSVHGVDQTSLVIESYASSTNTWSIVKQQSYGKQQNGNNVHFYFNFAIEYNGKSFIGIQFLNSKEIEVWAFDPVVNSLEKVSQQSTPALVSFAGLVHLFTLNGLAYFTETGESQLSSTTAVVTAPSSRLYVYNFTLNHWRTIEKALPEPMYSPTRFTIGNRGFAGMSISSNGTDFIYSKKLWEFIPK